jgi:glycine/serine hydroxymethyltransferase
MGVDQMDVIADLIDRAVRQSEPIEDIAARTNELVSAFPAYPRD